MAWFSHKARRFRGLPTPLMALLVFSRFVFGLGLGAVLAARFFRFNWKLIGWITMGIGTVLAIPGAKRVLGHR